MEDAQRDTPKLFPIKPTGSSLTDACYSDGAMTTMLFAHIVTINSERTVIWQRFTAMLLANTLTLGFFSAEKAPKTFELLYFAVALGLFFCIAWLILTVRGWNAFFEMIDVANQFSLENFHETINPAAIGTFWRKGKRWARSDWVYGTVLGVIFLFMLAYILLLLYHLGYIKSTPLPH